MSKRFPVDRRDFLKLAVAGAVMRQALPAGAASTTSLTANSNAEAAPDRSDAPRHLQGNVERNWLGPQFWGNRLQDWRLAGGRIECVHDPKGADLRTVSLLTRELIGDHAEGTISATMGRVSPKGKGFVGFLIGAGAGKIDYRAAALVQRASGVNGGMLCVFNTDGRTSFREHTSEDESLKYAEIPSQTTVGASFGGGDVVLTLNIRPGNSPGISVLELVAEENGAVVSTSTLGDIKSADLLGGIMLVSASTEGPETARYWFRDVDTSGDKIAQLPERALGPILGTLFSMNGPVLKMTAQLMPVSSRDPQDVTLSIRENDTAQWKQVASQKVGPGYCATFRVADWDDSKDWQYRVSYAEDGTGLGHPMHYDGAISRDPRHTGRHLSIGLYSCTMATARSLEGGGGRRPLPQSRELGRYAPESMYFPYNEIVSASLHHDPDMAVFAGDQFYETNPTGKERGETPVLDYLYKYYLWLWSFRELTRNRPTLVLIDDHDVYHGNLWGNGGREAPDDNQDYGGYVKAASWVNMVHNTQCGHNPDPWDPRPVKQGISVYYCAFSYGGVEFSLLEDRKFKTSAIQGSSMNVHVAELLGERQEKFLEEWGQKVKDAEARICLTQTLLGCAQTSPDGLPVVDFDSNGYPPLARQKALRLVRDADALLLSGDQHLGSVIRLGDETFTDGPIQFSGPAGAASWTRWFEPAEPLPNAGSTPHTGDFTDGFANKMHVLAVANPSITFAEYRKHIKGRTQGIGDRALKAEGYGIVKVDLDKREYTLESWRWDVDPAVPDAKQYAGWPVVVGFDEVAQKNG